MTREVPAVVLGAGANGLGVARSLARARIPVWLLDDDGKRPEMYTRAAKALQIGALHGETLVEELVRLAARRFVGLRPVLFLTQEETVKTVSYHREQLSAFYRFALPPVAVVDALQHKHSFQQLAERLGGPIPPLVHIRSQEDFLALAGLCYPVVVKPGERHAEYGRQFKKAYRVENVGEATSLLRRILAIMSDVVVQEWIEGPDSNIYFCLQYLDHQGNVAASFAGRKIRSWPPHVGGTASCTAAPEAHAALSELTARFFQGAGVVGMASMEYKRDERSGGYRMVEPTIGRTDYQEEVATLNGVNLPYAAWCSEVGRPSPEPVVIPRPVTWRVHSEDLQSAVMQGEQKGPAYPRGNRVADALWRWMDPVPSFVQNARRVRSALYRRTVRLTSGSQAARSKP